jgi:hypothetical protein
MLLDGFRLHVILDVSPKLAIIEANQAIVTSKRILPEVDHRSHAVLPAQVN